MKTQNISISNYHEQFVSKQLKAGYFTNISEVFRAGLNLLERQAKEDEIKLEVLRKRAQIGIDQIARGESYILESSSDIEQFLDGIENEIDNKHKQA